MLTVNGFLYMDKIELIKLEAKREILVEFQKKHKKKYRMGNAIVVGMLIDLNIKIQELQDNA